MGNPGATISERLGAYVAALRWGSLPAPVAQRTLTLFIDGLGNLIGGLDAPAALAVRKTVKRLGGTPEAAVFGTGDRSSAMWAALAGGTALHCLELDDTHAQSFTHTGAAVIPAALAVGEAVGARGDAVLAAVAAGFETAVRTAVAVNPSHRFRGFHTTATAGVFGAAATAGSLYGADAATIASAIGIAGSQAAGLVTFLTDGVNLKRVHPGLAAAHGILSLLLAQDGVEGPPHVFEGKHGYLHAYSDEADASVYDDLGDRYRLLEVGVKPYPACRFAHASVDAARKARAQFAARESRVALDTIAGVEIVASELCVDQTGKFTPVTLLDRQMSTPYAAAAGILYDRPTLDRYEPADPAILALAGRTRMTVDPALPRTSRHATVRVQLQDGRAFEGSQAIPSGEPETMPTASEIDDKFIELASRTIASASARDLATFLRSERWHSDVRILTDALTAAVRRQ